MVFSVFKTAPDLGVTPKSHGAPNVVPRAEAAVAPKTTRKGSIVGVLSAKGGSGATTLAVNMSALLADRAGSTVLVDANLQNPDAALFLGQTAQFGLLELLTGASAPTPEAVNACSIHFSGRQHEWSLLSPPVSGEAALKTHLSSIASCLKATRWNSDYWIVDLSNHLDRHLVTMLDACDVIVVVFEETLAGVSAARRWFNTFQQLEYNPQNIVYVMNRTGSKNRAAEAQIRELLPATAIKVPNAFSLLDESLAAGEPPVVTNRRHKFSQSIAELVERVSGIEVKNNG